MKKYLLTISRSLKLVFADDDILLVELLEVQVMPLKVLHKEARHRLKVSWYKNPRFSCLKLDG